MAICVKDYIAVVDTQGNGFIGQVVNISDYRPAEMKYAVLVDGVEDYVFAGENNIYPIVNYKNQGE